MSCGLFLFRAPLLRCAARAWIIDDPATNADAILVLGGGLEDRPFAAARIYSNLVHQSAGISASQRFSVSASSPVVLVSQPKLSPTSELGITTPESVLAREVLLSNDVPANAIQMLGTNLTSTFDEARALEAWVAQHHAHSVIIPTDIFHTRRARWIFKRVQDSGLRDQKTNGLNNAAPGSSTPLVPGPLVFSFAVHVVAVDPPQYTATNWWQTEEGLIAFQNEVIKWLYYHLKY